MEVNDGKDIIGNHKYSALKNGLNRLDYEDTDAILRFRKEFRISVSLAEKECVRYEEKNSWRTEEISKEAKDYIKKIHHGVKTEVKKEEMTKDWLWERFEEAYLEQNKVRYSRDADSLENIKPLIYYFIGDLENFRVCKNVASLSSKPSLDKGLLIIGGYGNGKTSSLKALETALQGTNVSFKIYSANEVVSMYESTTDNSERKEFYKLHLSGVRCFDDVLSEREANNYGKANLIKDILEERYMKNKRTYITVNYLDQTATQKAEDLQTSLKQIGAKYGSRVYDRLFQMFNIVEFKGKSFRK